jgi:hypothetical protein
MLLPKIMDGDLVSFVRAEGGFFVVQLNGRERAISREAWRLLPEQVPHEQDGVYQLHHYRKCRGRNG